MQKTTCVLKRKIKVTAENAKEKILILWKKFRAEPWCFLAIAATIGIIALNMIVPFTERRGRSLLFLITPVATAFFIGPLAVQKKLINNIGSVLLSAYAVWLGVSRLFLENQSFEHSINRISLALFVGVLAVNLPYFFSERGKEKARAIIADMGVLFCTCTALLAFVFVVLGARIKLWGAYHICESFVLSDGRIYCFHEHPNICAELFVIGICLAVMRAMEVRKVWMKIIYAAAAVMFFIVLVMTDSRACILIACAVLAVAAGLIFFNFMKGRFEGGIKQRTFKVAAGLICGAIVFTVAYASTDMFRSGVVMINNAVTSSQQEELTDSETVTEEIPSVSVSDEQPAVTVDEVVSEGSTEPEAMESVPVVQDQENVEDGFVLSDRDFSSLEELASLNSRTRIYKYAIHMLKQNPKVLLFGEQYSQEMILTTEEFGYCTYIAHWHNSLLEVLFETGVIGFVLMAAFTVYIIWKMIVIFFGSFEKYSLVEKFSLSIPAVSVLISLIEPMLFSFDIQSALLPSIIYFIFVVMCGVTIATSNKERSEYGETDK